MLNNVKHLAKASCKVPTRDPSATTFCQDDIITRMFPIILGFKRISLQLNASRLPTPVRRAGARGS